MNEENKYEGSKKIVEDAGLIDDNEGHLDVHYRIIADLLKEVKWLRGLLDEIDEQIYSVVDGLPIEKVNLELLRDIMMSYTDEAYQIRGDEGGWIE